MKSNEDYLDELLKSMGEDGSEESLLSDLDKVDEEMELGKMDQAMIDALLAGATEDVDLDDIVDEKIPLEKVSIEETQFEDSQKESSSMLAQLMEEMQEEVQDIQEGSFDDDLMTEESIEALLNAARNSGADVSEESSADFEVLGTTEMSEIEELLEMSENGEILEESRELLRMLEE